MAVVRWKEHFRSYPNTLGADFDGVWCWFRRRCGSCIAYAAVLSGSMFNPWRYHSLRQAQIIQVVQPHTEKIQGGRGHCGRKRPNQVDTCQSRRLPAAYSDMERHRAVFKLKKCLYMPPTGGNSTWASIDDCIWYDCSLSHFLCPFKIHFPSPHSSQTGKMISELTK